ncbi:hypothetical protein ACF3OA_13290 [Enterococcus thailandicus]|uniref:hypothetical protein n=1 Tax=Enterococcus thailandicus TaxID=417368 RepID=UPI003751A37C
MNYTQQELAVLCPEEVAEFINNEVLPEYADGINSAKMIANQMVDDAIVRLNLAEIDCIVYYAQYSNVALIDSYIVQSHNLKIIRAYIQTVFDNWSEEIRTSLKKTEIAYIFNEFSRDYNERSNIPLKLVEDIFKQLESQLQILRGEHDE